MCCASVVRQSLGERCLVAQMAKIYQDFFISICEGFLIADMVGASQLARANVKTHFARGD